MQTILENPLNQDITVFNKSITNSRTQDGTFTDKEERKAFIFSKSVRVIENDREQYRNKTCIILKSSIDRDSKVLVGLTAETDAKNTDARVIMDISPEINHNGEIEGYEVILT